MLCASTSVPPSLIFKISKDCDVSTVLSSLQNEIHEELGITNILERYQENKPYLSLQSLENFLIWRDIISIIIRNVAVEWVDISSKIVASAIPTFRVESVNNEFTVKRRLDDYIDDVLGVTDAKNAGVRGNDIVVGITDTGLYIDHDQFDQESRRIYDELDLTARKVVSYETFGDNVDQGERITCGHGTHVAGILSGSSNTGGNDMGIASESKIAFMDIGTQRSCSGTVGCPVDLLTPLEANLLFSNQINAGARIFSFSWGTLESDYSSQVS